jgi:hypothetical protein
MSRFSIRNPHFIVVVCLVLLVIGATSFARMPVDLFPTINLPEVVVATFYSGMPPEDIETDITNPLERFFTHGQRHGPHGVALAVGRQHHQSLLPTRHQRRRRRDATFQPRPGGPEAAASGHLAARGAQVRCFQPAGVPGYLEGRGIGRNPTPRYRTIHHPQPDRRGERRGNSASLRRQIPPGRWCTWTRTSSCRGS